ncbi:MAG: YaaR family protein [Clostridia bacterium]|jgi:uncharacterized protein YaaR (DUF327 family)|nr:YaaR family protein [Clostridiales bacterium]
MKIRDVTGGSPGPVTGKGTGRRATQVEAGQGRFEESLSKERSNRMEERITAMLADIEEQGKRMAGSLSLKDLLAYKSKVKAFMEEAVEGMFKFAKNSTMDRRGRHRIYSLVKRINKQLEELTEEMVGGQRDRFKILEKADNIRGLLVDLYT